jgi:hypothetical protein
MTYAQTTDVPIDRSKAEIEKVLRRHGSEGFGYISQGGNALVIFQFRKIPFRIEVKMPEIGAFEQTPRGRARRNQAIEREYEQACRSKWRALLLVIKAKLEAVEQGISTIEHEFAADIVTESGKTLGQVLDKQLAVGKFKALPMFTGDFRDETVKTKEGG